MTHDSSWDNFIKNSKHYKEMLSFVNSQTDICPEKENVFRFLNCNLSSIKCIILGMDPYPSVYDDSGVARPVATGRAFEVANVKCFTDKYKQSSLSNIFKTLCYYKFGKKYSIEELREKFKDLDYKYINTRYWFDDMERQGIMFLNATLTTKISKAGAHISEWSDFMDELITYINNNSDCMWLIWGDVALSRVKGLVDEKKIIYSCHPASRANNNFIEDCCFKKVKGINWF